jgi:hypothetical protein
MKISFRGLCLWEMMFDLGSPSDSSDDEENDLDN